MAKINTKKQLILLLILCLAIFSLMVVASLPFSTFLALDNGAFVTESELNFIKAKNRFGPFVFATIENKDTVATSSQNEEVEYTPQIQFKLFNLLPIKTKKVKLLKNDKILVSGSAIGLVLKTEGVLVVGSSPISTDDGEKDIIEDRVLQVGDIIKRIENETIDDVLSIAKIINKEENRGRELTINLIRKGREMEVKLTPTFDNKSESYKLGVWARDDASGIGTLTYIENDLRFGALGHPICDSDTKSQIALKEGKVYNCSILGVNKGKSGTPGEIKGLFMQGKNEQGVVEKNNSYGVFGNLNKENVFKDKAKEMEIGGRLSVKPGRAQIRSCIDGTNIETFDIEIIKTNFQSYSNDKSMVIRVIDQNLLDRTGGIVQGMSGSPIIQNGKIVGAVTHVFLSDASKGFGVYIDWMLNQ